MKSFYVSLVLKIYFLANIFHIANSSNFERVSKWTHAAEPIDPEGKYILSWEVDLEAETVVFNVEVETIGFVGFGISPSGSMAGADIFISGVDSISGFNYAFDMHGIGNQAPIRDRQANWNLLQASENGTHTSLKFSRLLNTCDNEDYAITEDTTRIIWSFGQTDDISYHGVNRGTTSFNVISPPTPEFDPTRFDRFEISTNHTLTSADTSYFCTIHKSPNFQTINHIVAMGAALENTDAKKFTHHFILFVCEAPPGENPSEIFEPWVYPGYEGHECYDANNPLPIHLCHQKFLYVWAVGGKMTVFPENLGLPTPTGETYYLLDVHFDNPGLESGKEFKTGLEIYHTPNLRETEIGVSMIYHSRDPSLLVPPSTSDFMIASNCPSECTSTYFPPQGITVFNVLLHSHLSGRKMKMRQFRNNEELPWLASDENYDFNYQQNKPLKEPWPVILPGDDLRVECIYDTKWKEGNVVLGGMSSRDEMCEAIFYYYPKIEVDGCFSNFPFAKTMEDFGVTNYTIDYSNPAVFKAKIISPPELAGDFEEVLNSKFNWTDAFIEAMREKMKFGDQEFGCGNINGVVKHPSYDKEYVPEDKCLK